MQVFEQARTEPNPEPLPLSPSGEAIASYLEQPLEACRAGPSDRDDAQSPSPERGHLPPGEGLDLFGS